LETRDKLRETPSPSIIVPVRLARERVNPRFNFSSELEIVPFTPASMSTPDIFTITTVYALAAVIGIGVIAKIGSDVLLPKNASSKDKFTFIWLVCIFPSVH
jgi:hypothetical protein